MKRARFNGLQGFAARLLIFVMVCGVLYWGSAIFIPVALAILLSLILSPAVRKLHRWHLPKAAAVMMIVALVAAAIGFLLWAVTSQVASLAKDVPQYRGAIKAKWGDIRGVSKGGSIEKIQNTIEEVSQEIEAEEKADDAAKSMPTGTMAPSAHPTAAPEPTKPVEVTVVKGNGFFAVQNLPAMLPVASMLGQAGLVLILVIMLLIAEDDLRDRIASLAGETRMAVTTTALIDAGRRISSYLGTQLVLNASYGVVVGIGLTLFEIPYAILWGVCAAVFRYIPYVGPWMAALWPVGISMLVSSDWWPVLWVVALFAGLELLFNNVLEPWLFGRSAGVPAFILLVTAVFWTWLWGPVGLILATPLTMCLVVLGDHFESLRILSQLLGSRKHLPDHLLLYQRLLSLNEEEAAEMLQNWIPKKGAFAEIKSGVDEMSRTVLAPLLTPIKRDSLLNVLSDENKSRILQFFDSQIETLATNYSEGVDSSESQGEILICPAADEVDETASRLLALVLKIGGVSCSVLSSTMLASEIGIRARQSLTRMLCIVSVGPGGMPACLSMCKRLSRLGLDTKIAATYWSGLTEGHGEALKAAGAEWVADGLAEADDRLTALAQFYRGAEPPPSPAARPVPV